MFLTVLGLSLYVWEGSSSSFTTNFPFPTRPGSSLDISGQGGRVSTFDEDGFSLRSRRSASGTQGTYQIEDRLSSRLKGEYRAVIANDADRPLPNLIVLDSEEVPGIGTLTLDKVIATERYSRVFAVKDRPDLAIKYQANCYHLDRSMHPLVADYIFSNLASDSVPDIVMKPIYLSPPALIPIDNTMKTHFNLQIAEWEKCKNGRGTVRFMVMPRAMRCLNRVRLNLKVALQFAGFLVKSLARLHSDAGIMHGDVHAGNVCYLESGSFVFIDFGKAGFVEDELDHRNRSPSQAHFAHSPWQMQGFRSARRDDVFKAIYSVADVLHESALSVHAYDLLESKKNWPKCHEWKMTSLFFIDPVPLDPSSASSETPSALPAVPREVREAISEALTMVRSLSTSESPIDYEGIAAKLSEASSLVEQSL